MDPEIIRICLLAIPFLLSGCTTTLVQDNVSQASGPLTPCAGDDWVSDSSVAVLPVPIAAFFVPHADTDEIRADDYLSQCGRPQDLVNRKVEVDRTACIPTSLTRFITLGIWQWCPARVSWEADVQGQ